MAECELTYGNVSSIHAIAPRGKRRTLDVPITVIFEGTYNPFLSDVEYWCTHVLNESKTQYQRRLESFTQRLVGVPADAYTVAMLVMDEFLIGGNKTEVVRSSLRFEGVKQTLTVVLEYTLMDELGVI